MSPAGEHRRELAKPERIREMQRENKTRLERRAALQRGDEGLTRRKPRRLCGEGARSGGGGGSRTHTPGTREARTSPSRLTRLVALFCFIRVVVNRPAPGAENQQSSV